VRCIVSLRLKLYPESPPDSATHFPATKLSLLASAATAVNQERGHSRGIRLNPFKRSIATKFHCTRQPQLRKLSSASFVARRLDRPRLLVLRF